MRVEKLSERKERRIVSKVDKAPEKKKEKAESDPIPKLPNITTAKKEQKIVVLTSPKHVLNVRTNLLKKTAAEEETKIMKGKHIPKKLQLKTADEMVTKKIKIYQMPKKPRPRLKTGKNERMVINLSDSNSDEEPILDSSPKVSDEENQCV
ncbi:hypothetical protein JTB14_006489 [Gonioctena quinquepunctata]|nr:hypothetical protein JTB14_006489 [Gonioctena quinquepunctata]